jgi:hypothetical protein
MKVVRIIPETYEVIHLSNPITDQVKYLDEFLESTPYIARIMLDGVTVSIENISDATIQFTAYSGDYLIKGLESNEVEYLNEYEFQKNFKVIEEYFLIE